MKRRNLQRMLALTLTGAMAAGMLAGCGSSESAPAAAPQDEATTEAPAADDAATEAETEAVAGETAAAAGEETAAGEAVPGTEGHGDVLTVDYDRVEEPAWEPFAENVTLKIPVYDRGVEGVPAVDNNFWTQWVQENFGDRYNITVEYVPITRTDVLADYALLAASDSLPTLLTEFDYPKLAQWVTDGYLQTYDVDQFKEIAPNYYGRMEQQGQLPYTTVDDEPYFALAELPYYDTTYTWVTFYRKDWCEQVGYESYPAKWADRKDMYQKIIDAGLSEHPLGGSMVTGLGSDQNYAFRTYPQDEKNWVAYGDYSIPPLGDEANRKFLQRQNEMYNLGFTDPEYYVTDAETDKSNFVSGKTLQYGGYISTNMDFLTAFYQQNPDGKLGVMISDTTVDDDGSVPYAFRSNNPFGVMIGFSSQASEDEIKAAEMYLEWMSMPDVLFTFQFGFEGENFDFNENGLPVMNVDYDGDRKMGFSDSKDYWNIAIGAKNAGTIEDIIRQSSPQGLPQDFSEDIIANYYGQKALAEAGYSVKDCLFATSIDSLAEYQETLIDDYKEFRDQIVMSDPADFDATYDELAQNFADDGFQEIVDEKLQAYEDGKTTKLD